MVRGKRGSNYPSFSGFFAPGRPPTFILWIGHRRGCSYSHFPGGKTEVLWPKVTQPMDEAAMIRTQIDPFPNAVSWLPEGGALGWGGGSLTVSGPFSSE